jgi:hypothetical protein
MLTNVDNRLLFMKQIFSNRFDLLILFLKKQLETFLAHKALKKVFFLRRYTVIDRFESFKRIRAKK